MNIHETASGESGGAQSGRPEWEYVPYATMFPGYGPGDFN